MFTKTKTFLLGEGDIDDDLVNGSLVNLSATKSSSVSDFSYPGARRTPKTVTFQIIGDANVVILRSTKLAHFSKTSLD